MANNPLNLALRFLLELAAIITMAIWGFHISENASGIIFSILLPLGFALLWGVFAVPNDPSRSGKTVIPTSGILRLLLELGLFAAATWMIFDLGYSPIWWVFGIVVLLHYLLSYERVSWLLKQK